MLLGCGATVREKTPPVEPTPVSESDYAVYSDALPQLFPRDSAGAWPLVVSELTAQRPQEPTRTIDPRTGNVELDRFCLPFCDIAVDVFVASAGLTLDSSVTERLELLSDTVFSLEPLFAESLAVTLVSEHEADRLIESKGGRESWDEHFANPRPLRIRVGLITLSRVSFSRDSHRALMYYGYWCGLLCGWGNLVLLERQGDMWIVIAERGLWVS